VLIECQFIFGPAFGKGRGEVWQQRSMRGIG
jgi:hypothetical protein